MRFDWSVQTTANFLIRSTDDEVRLMRKSGMTRAFIGAESGSDDVLSYVNKVRFQNTAILHEVAAKCHRAGITCTFSLIFGLPGETEADRRKTLAMVRGIKSRYPGTEFHSNIYTPYPGAPNFKHALAMGLREPDSLESWAAFYPKFQRLPWIDNRTHRHIQRMREYIRIAYGAAPVRRRSSVRAAAHRVLAPIARARLNRDQYTWPIELWALRSMSRLKHSLGFRNVRTHVTQS